MEVAAKLVSGEPLFDCRSMRVRRAATDVSHWIVELLVMQRYYGKTSRMHQLPRMLVGGGRWPLGHFKAIHLGLFNLERWSGSPDTSRTMMNSCHGRTESWGLEDLSMKF